jgi:hypothetical protein
MRLLPEQVQVRRAIGDGIGRSLRDIYQVPDVIPDRLRALLSRLEQVGGAVTSKHELEHARRAA